MKRWPFSSSALPPSNWPTRSLGPCRSNRMVVGRWNSFSRARMWSTSFAFAFWSPWLMLMRKASAPASISLRIIAGLLVAGPSVARIFTLRDRGARVSVTAIALSRLIWRFKALQPGQPFKSVEQMMAEGTVAADQLRLFIERIERLEEEKKGISDDVRDVYAEAKANGYDPKIMRMIVRLRKMETHTRQEQDAVLETYRAALGLE